MHLVAMGGSDTGICPARPPNSDVAVLAAVSSRIAEAGT
jgi:hypothetical protein